MWNGIPLQRKQLQVLCRLLGASLCECFCLSGLIRTGWLSCFIKMSLICLAFDVWLDSLLVYFKTCLVSQSISHQVWNWDACLGQMGLRKEMRKSNPIILECLHNEQNRPHSTYGEWRGSLHSFVWGRVSLESWVWLTVFQFLFINLI